MEGTLDKTIAYCALGIGFAVGERISEIPRHQRGAPATSILKPKEHDKARFADAEGEKVGFDRLTRLSEETSLPIAVIVNPQEGDVYEIGNHSSHYVIYCYFDAVDGTIKVAGLGNDTERGIYRVGNNGTWATGIAFTPPTDKDLSNLVVGDFKISAIVDGNLTVYRVYPTNALSSSFDDKLVTSEFDIVTKEPKRLFTSSQTNLSQATILFDAFQAYDRNSAPKDAEKLPPEIFRRIINRNEGGVFDIVHMYGTMGEVLRQLLETREDGVESQSVGSIAVNENLPNLVPITPIIEGAGGYVVDFNGKPVRDLPLTSGRPNVVIAANEAILGKLLEITHSAYQEVYR